MISQILGPKVMWEPLGDVGTPVLALDHTFVVYDIEWCFERLGDVGNTIALLLSHHRAVSIAVLHGKVATLAHFIDITNDFSLIFIKRK